MITGKTATLVSECVLLYLRALGAASLENELWRGWEADWDPGGPTQTDRSFTAALYTHHCALMDWRALTERFVRHSGRLKKLKNRNVRVYMFVCVSEYVTSATWLSDEASRQGHTWCNNLVRGPPRLFCTQCCTKISPPARCMSCGLIVMQGGKFMGAGGLCTSTKVPICPPPPHPSSSFLQVTTNSWSGAARKTLLSLIKTHS